MEQLKIIRERQKRLSDSGVLLKMEYREKQLKRLQSILAVREQELLTALKEDFNKPEYEGYISEVGFVQDELKKTLRNLKRWMKPRHVKAPLTSFPGRGRIIPEPLGQVLVIAPWNYPVNLSLAPLIAAAAAGNTVVLHPSDQSPRTAQVLESLVAEAFPDGQAAVINGGVAVSEALTRESWDFLFFTGSTRVGKIVYQEAARTLTPVVLELGGKSPCVVSGNANLKEAARRITWGKFLNAGQTCVAPDYLLVHETVREEFLDLLTAEIRRVYGDAAPGSDNLAHIVNDRNYRRIVSYLEEGRILYGGRRDPDTRFIEPTVMDRVNWDSPVMQEEIFGPLLPVLTYREDREIFENTARSPDPLAFYYFGRPDSRAYRIMKTVPYGGGCLNDAVMHLANTNMPFGGRGSSGLGRYHGKFGFETFSHMKSIHTTFWRRDTGLRFWPYKKSKLDFARLVMS